MELGMVGLGRMGANMTRRLVDAGHRMVVFDLDPSLVEKAAGEGAEGATSLEDLAARLTPRRAVWCMVPSGEPTRATVDALVEVLEAGDIIVEGGNSNYKDARSRATALADRGLSYVDAGVSGGVWGLKNGYCLMVGGDPAAVGHLEPVFRDLAPPDGYAHVGPPGAGHYTKMIHNGIEYGMLQAYAEGFAILESATEFDLDLHQVAALWNRGSVVRSWLLELAELALANADEFASIRGYIEDSGEGRWTVEEALERAVAAPVITAALFARYSSRDDERFAARIVAALRNQFGGHRFFTEAAAAEQSKKDTGAADGQLTDPESPSTSA